MTDKQIIIGGVDVSSCEFLTKTGHCKAHISIMGTDTNKCKCFPNCHFKQLKRKEQECEKAKQNAQDTYDLWQALIDSFNILQGDKIKLEQEFERLKEDEKSLLNVIDHLQKTKNEWEEKYNDLGQDFDQLKAQLLDQEAETLKAGGIIYNLEQTLTEIKEIVEQISLPMGTGKSGNRVILAKQILQKISEVE